MISLLTPLLPVARILEVPVLDFDTYLKLQDSVEVAKDPWEAQIYYFFERKENGRFVRLYSSSTRMSLYICLYLVNVIYIYI